MASIVDITRSASTNSYIVIYDDGGLMTIALKADPEAFASALNAIIGSAPGVDDYLLLGAGVDVLLLNPSGDKLII